MFGLNSKVNEVSVEEIKKMMEKGDKLTIIDVRTEPEFERGRIEGSINIPLDKIDTATNKIADKNSNVYVYCLSGSRSAMAAGSLVKMGYKNTYNIKSGLLAWRAKQYPLLQS